MTTETKQTPILDLPWKRKPDPNNDSGDYVINNREDSQIALVHDEPDAEFIVRACNSYADLLVACKMVYLDGESLTLTGSENDVLRAAIDKAEGR